MITIKATVLPLSCFFFFACSILCFSQANATGTKNPTPPQPPLIPAAANLGLTSTDWNPEDKEAFLKCVGDSQMESYRLARQANNYAFIYTFGTIAFSVLAVLSVFSLHSSHLIQRSSGATVSIRNPTYYLSLSIIFILLAAISTLLMHTTDVDGHYSLYSQRATSLTILRAKVAIGFPGISKQGALNEFSKIMTVTSY